MEHAKKMMLVDTNFDIGNIKRRHTLLDQNISEVLDRQDLDDREKIKLYQQTLNKYLVNRKLIEKELNRPLKVEVAANKTESVAEPDKVKNKTRIRTRYKKNFQSARNKDEIALGNFRFQAAQ